MIVEVWVVGLNPTVVTIVARERRSAVFFGLRVKCGRQVVGTAMNHLSSSLIVQERCLIDVTDRDGCQCSIHQHKYVQRLCRFLALV